MAAQSEFVAAELQRRGVQVGDRVVVCLPNSTDAITSLYGVWQAGACLVMADADSTLDSLAYRVAHSGATAIIVPEARRAHARVVADGLAGAPAVVVIDDLAVPLDDPQAPSYTAPPFDPDDPAAIIYTSGSVGPPKGVTHSQRSISAAVSSVAEYLQHTPDDVVLCVLEPAFGYGLLQVLVTFETGGRLVLKRGFGLPFDVVSVIESERVTGLAGVPTLFALLCELRDISALDMSSLRYLTNAGAALAPPLSARVRAMFPSARLFLMYGQTECFRTSYLPPEEVDTRPLSVGRGMPGVELWLEDEQGNVLPNGSQGELVVRGENVMLGYWNNSEATAQVLASSVYANQRVLHTGDLFRTDDDGFFYFVSRTDDIIKVRGKKVAPNEIENRLAERAEIAQSRVIGVPHDVLGQAIRAEVVLRPGCALTESELRRFLRQGLEPYKVPQTIVFVDELPKSASGKVLRTFSGN